MSAASARIRCAIVAATGAVGQRFVALLADHPTFEVAAVCASMRSQGKRYGDAANWILDSELPADTADLVVIDAADLDPAATPVVFSALPTEQAVDGEPALAARGFKVFTNASPHRMDADVPLLIPEVNADAIEIVDSQPGPGWIVANGNCSGIILTLALAPLQRKFGLDEVDVTTLQGLSGAGYPGVSALDVVDNVVPFISGEEDKLQVEACKTLGGSSGPASFTVRPTCTRVPVRDGHLESVHVRLASPTTLDAVRAAFAEYQGPADVAALPSAPAHPILVTDAADRPQPRRDRDAGNGMSVTVGRIRGDGHHFQFVVLGHNTLRGAAGQSVLNAEYAAAKGML